ncbi:MAG: hypothetical protein U0359_20100 [Byssovorax sp.]
MKRSEMPTVRIKLAPVVLVLGASPAFVRRCHEIAAGAQAVVVETDVSSFSQVALQTRARAMVIPEALFNASTVLFTTLAGDAGTQIVTVPSESIDQEDLETRLLAALGQPRPAPGSASGSM